MGPRLALAVLSVHSPQDVRRAIRDSDTAAFTRVPGIGKKTAQRILLELVTSLFSMRSKVRLRGPAIRGVCAEWGIRRSDCCAGLSGLEREGCREGIGCGAPRRA
ncbi:helix-hairpin-helix domain-containing protein [Nesterenkonia pannonica]|uniref:helix-hairpin-helix domain-containing protein n=1 Tax=Nesterenkonia pannonica TaxID=1548602 RepID=UPI0021645760|nr:helix-hairpin-helix domain-containing protein [Nesterenkonia pannonica]